MALPEASALGRQLGRVRRRLFLGALLTALAWAWVGALALAAGWFLVQPYLVPAGAPWLRWAVAGGLGGAATAAAVALAARRAPSPVAAALSLDERFGLKERVTTSLTLEPAQAASPAGQALLADAAARVAPLRVGDRFPVRLPRVAAALLPFAAAALALVAIFWKPQTTGAGQDKNAEAAAVAPEAKADIEDKVKKALANRAKKKPGEALKAEDIDRIDAEAERLFRKPRDTKADIRERLKEATALEEEIKKAQKERAERAEAFKERMKQLERLADKDKKEEKKDPEKKDGPGDGLDKAMADARFQDAQREAEDLARKLEAEDEAKRLKKKLEKDEKKKDGDPGKMGEDERKKAEEKLKKAEKDQLSKKDKEDLEKKMDQMKEKLDKMAEDGAKAEKELRERAKKGELDPEQLERELAEMKKADDKLKKDKEEIKDLAKKVGECKECMKEGKEGEAAQKMADAARQMGKMDKGGEAKDLDRKAQDVRDVKKALAKGLGGAAPAAGERPESKEGETGSEERRLASDPDDKGKLEVVGHSPGGGFKGPKKPSEMREDLRRASEEGAAAIDRQRYPPSVKKMARDYFEDMRPAEKKK